MPGDDLILCGIFKNRTWAAGVPVSTHLYPQAAAHVMWVTANAHWLEWQDWADPIWHTPYDIRDELLKWRDLLLLAKSVICHREMATTL